MDRWPKHPHPWWLQMLDEDTRRARRATNLVARVRRQLANDSVALGYFEAAVQEQSFGVDAILSAPQSIMGSIVVALYLLRLPPENLKDAFLEAWYVSHRSVTTAARENGNCFFPMLRYLRMQPPLGTPPEITIWRGTAGVNLLTGH